MCHCDFWHSLHDLLTPKAPISVLVLSAHTNADTMPCGTAGRLRCVVLVGLWPLKNSSTLVWALLNGLDPLGAKNAEAARYGVAPGHTLPQNTVLQRHAPLHALSRGASASQCCAGHCWRT